MICEARPNVTIDAAILCLKAGDAVILRGGSEALHSNTALAALLRQALEEAGLPADAAMNGRQFFDAANAGEPEALEVLERFCKMVAVQIYNLNVLLDLEKVAIGGGISKQPILVETLNEVYEEYILRGHPFSEAQARCLPRPEIVPCRFLSEANQIGAFASYQKAFLEK